MAYGFNDDKSKVELEPLPITLGGTGANTAENARNNLKAVTRKEITVGDSGSPDFLLSTLTKQNVTLTPGVNYVDISKPNAGYYTISTGGVRLNNNNPNLYIQGAYISLDKITAIINNTSGSNITANVILDIVQISSKFKNS